MKIDDGTGNGYQAKVNKANKIETHSISEDESIHSAEVGDAYNINTGLISITGDATLLYLKNNEDADMVIEAVALGSFEGITHSDDPYVTLIKNPSAGDLITDATAVTMNQNRNFGSSKTLTADVFKGKVAGTITGGNDAAILQASTGGRSYYTINMIIPKGSSLAIKLTANVSSGTANWYAAIIMHLKDTRFAE